MKDFTQSPVLPRRVNLTGTLAALKAKLARGAAQAERGERVDPADVMKKIDALKRRRATGKA